MAAPLENIAAEQEDIPEDVLMMILSQLPPTSLIRFKSVSKSWNTTITHPHLATLFDDVAKMRDRNTFLIIGAHPDVDTGTKSTATDPLIAAKIVFDMKTRDSLQVSYDKKYAPLRLRCKYKYAEVLGACSGVICVARESGGEAVLWNPATREEKWVKVSYPGISAFGEYLRYIGFASVKDEKNNIVDFKLLVEQFKPHLFLVYSLCLNSWRLINPPDFLKDEKVYCRFRPNGVYLHGVLHWLVPILKDFYFYIFTSMEYTTYLYLNSEIHKLDPELSGRLKFVQYRESFVSMKRIAGVT